jgi:hypothetical protein
MLTAGVMEEGNFLPTHSGTLQGGLASPILSNVILHNSILRVDGTDESRGPRQEVTGEPGAATSGPPGSAGAGWRRTPVMAQRAVLRSTLHCVLDLWVEAWRKRVGQGDMVVVRFADDVVRGFAHRSDAERFLAAMRDRLQQFGLNSMRRRRA